MKLKQIQIVSNTPVYGPYIFDLDENGDLWGKPLWTDRGDDWQRWANPEEDN